MMMELSVFVEQNPKRVHYMEWPTCDLYDAIVWSPKSNHQHNLIDLLDVLEKGPFNVKGRIKSIPENLKEFGIATRTILFLLETRASKLTLKVPE